MEAAFDGLCALVNKEGMCRQCAGFRDATAPERRGPQLPILNNPEVPSSETAWERRLAVVRETPFDGGVSTTLHDLLFDRIRRIEGAVRAEA